VGIGPQDNTVRGDHLLLQGDDPSGGAEGVGRAVNQAIVTTFLAIGAFNYVFTQTLLATHPNILVLK
jgi:phospholipid/cholesterol/gamma-HCH transport system permease protein